MSAELKKSIVEWAIILSFLVVGYAAWELTPDWKNTQPGVEPETPRTTELNSGSPTVRR